MVTEQEYIFEVIQLTKTLQSAGDTIPVIRNVNFSISKGEFVLVCGSRGSGKSLLFYTLIGLEPPTTGTVFMDGVDMYALSETERAILRRRNIGIIYKTPTWIHSLNVLQNIEFFIHLSDPLAENVHERAISIVKTIGAEQWMYHKPTDLDIPTQIVISIGRALASHPVVLMGDDITNTLDAAGGQKVMKALQTVHDHGVTIVLLTSTDHYIQRAARTIVLPDMYTEDTLIKTSAYL